MRLTKAQRSMARLIAGGMDARCMKRQEAEARGLLTDFDRARRAKLIISAGYETSGAADEWLQSPAGRAALDAEGER